MRSENKEEVKQFLQNIRQDPVSGSRETAHGVLYEPKPLPLQIVFLIGAFAASPGIGWLSSRVLDDVSPARELVFDVPPLLVFFFGYALWSARLAAIAFDMIGRSLLVALFRMIVTRKKPERLEDVLPDREKLEHMVVRAQKAGSSFALVGTLVAATAGAIALLVVGMTGAVSVSLVCLVWGFVLGYLGRRGYLPLPETE